MAVKKFDYESVLERLKASVLSKLDGEQLLLFSTNSAFLEAAAEEFADSDLYNEFLTREAVWDTAQGYSSIMRQVGFYAYKPHRKIGSTGKVRISASETFSGSWGKNILIPRFTAMSGGGLTFLVKEQAILISTDSYAEVTVVQGDKQTFTAEITQTAYPELKYASVVVEDPDIENTLYVVKVNGEEWTEVDSIRNAESGTSKVYVMRTLPDFSGVEIKFGNDLFGKKLQYGDTVTLEYVKTKGSSGNVLSKGIVTSFDSSLKDENGEDVTLYCTNIDPLVGGSDYETIDEIRSYAPYSFQTGNRAISSNDYATLITKTGLTDKVQVWGEKEINEDSGNPPGTYIASAENLIYITGITIDDITGLGTPLTESAKSLIREFLNDKKGTTDILQFVNSQIVYVTFNSDVYISDTRYAADTVKQNIRSILKDEYSLKRTSYKKGLYFSDYYRTIDEAEGVDHHKTTLSFSEFFNFTSAYAFTGDINLNNILQGSIKLYVREAGSEEWKLMCHDNGAGIFVGDAIDPDDPSKGTYIVTSEEISYNSGTIGEILVTYGLDQAYGNYELRMDFAQQGIEDGNLELKYRQQIFTFYDSKATTHIMGAR